MAVLDFFMVSPGDRKRAELALQNQMRLNRAHIDDLTTAQQRVRDIEHVNNAKELEANLIRNLVGGGADPATAQRQAQLQAAQINVAPRLADLSTAQVTNARNQGILPNAQGLGDIQSKADAADAFARREHAGEELSTGIEAKRAANIASKAASALSTAISGARMGGAPSAAVAKDQMLEDVALNQSAEAQAMRPNILPVTTADVNSRIARNVFDTEDMRLKLGRLGMENTTAGAELLAREALANETRRDPSALTRFRDPIPGLNKVLGMQLMRELQGAMGSSNGVPTTAAPDTSGIPGRRILGNLR